MPTITDAGTDDARRFNSSTNFEKFLNAGVNRTFDLPLPELMLERVELADF